MQLVVIGAGYVGLVSAACFAEFGVTVHCLDRDEGRIAALQRGEMPLYEPGLQELVRRHSAAGRLVFGSDLPAAVGGADLVFLAVGTPPRPDDGQADLSQVEAAALAVAEALRGYTVVVTKSTVPVGTGRRLQAMMRQRRPDADFDIASNPEFLREGAAIRDFLKPDRVVVGCESERARALLCRLYRPLERARAPILCTGLETAELIKYAANAFLATKVSFVNEMADLCEKVGADVLTLARGVGLDRRIGPKFLQPGPGFGGSCFPKDTLALTATAAQAGTPLRLVETVVSVNEARKAAMAERILRLLGPRGGETRIGLLGVTFKADTDDLRAAPSLTIVPALQAAGVSVQAYDPAGMRNGAALLPGVEWCAEAYAALEGADALVLLTEWNEFRSLDLQRVRRLLRRPLVIDLRNLLVPEEVVRAGLTYHGLGRGAVRAAAAAGRSERDAAA